VNRYSFGRLLLAVPTLLGAVTLVFFLLRVIPGDPVRQALGEQASEETIRLLRQEMHLDRPLWEQYVRFLGSVAQGDFGQSMRTRQPVFDEVVRLLPHTIALAVAALLISLAVSVPAGIVSAHRRGRWPDLLLMVTTLFGVSLPTFWLGILFVLLFALVLGWLPTYGVAGEGAPIWEQVPYLVLPAVTLGLSIAALMARMTRSVMLDVLSEDYVRTAHAKGVSFWGVLRRHSLRNALLPLVTLLGIDAGRLLGGAIVVEVVFARPGLGRLLVESVQFRDYTVVQALTLVFAVGVVGLNLLVDLVNSQLDPRVRTA
jgi:ABC-type dipeptide/oligopeptide/nickel transport system permease component